MAIKKTELYSSLWASCDELRGGMDASQYKDYVLTLLFMKYSADYKDGIPKEIDSSIRNMAIIEMTIEHLTGKEAIELVKMKKVDKE